MNGTPRLRIAVAGAGLIGRRHVEAIRASVETGAGIADPGEAAPLVPGREGLRTLAVVEAIRRATLSGKATAVASHVPHEVTGHA